MISGAEKGVVHPVTEHEDTTEVGVGEPRLSESGLSAPGDRASGAPEPSESGASDSGQTLGKYVYGVVETDEEIELGPIGIGDGENRVYSVRYGDLAAVVSDTPLRLYDPTRENLMAHELVNETVMKEHTVIPMSFGTIFRTEDDIVELLRATEKAFRDVLAKIRDKIELGLKVLWDRERVVEQIEEQNSEVSGLKTEITESSKGSTYFARMQLGRLIENALEEKANEYITDLYETLRPVAVASRSNKLIGENMILNAAFLVDRDREEEFDEAVRSISLKYKGLLSFQYTGPWPPYNFVNIKLKLERADQ